MTKIPREERDRIITSEAQKLAEATEAKEAKRRAAGMGGTR